MEAKTIEIIVFLIPITIAAYNLSRGKSIAYSSLTGDSGGPIIELAALVLIIVLAAKIVFF